MDLRQNLALTWICLTFVYVFSWYPSVWAASPRPNMRKSTRVPVAHPPTSSPTRKAPTTRPNKVFLKLRLPTLWLRKHPLTLGVPASQIARPASLRLSTHTQQLTPPCATWQPPTHPEGDWMVRWCALHQTATERTQAPPSTSHALYFRIFLKNSRRQLQPWLKLATNWLKPLGQWDIKPALLPSRVPGQRSQMPPITVLPKLAKPQEPSPSLQLPTLRWGLGKAGSKPVWTTSLLGSGAMLDIDPKIFTPPREPKQPKKAQPPTWPPAMPKEFPVDWPERDPSQKPQWKASWEQGASISEKQFITMLTKADRLWNRKQFMAAGLLYRQILKNKPWHLPTLHRLARLHAWRKDFHQARQVYDDILLYNPGSPSALRGLGDIHLWGGKPEKAIRWYRLYLKRDPNNLKIWRNVARAAAQANQHKIAKVAYQKIKKADPNDVEALTYLSKKPRFSINAYTNQSFSSNVWRQEYHFAFGVRAWRELWFETEADLRLRFHPDATFSDLFLSGSVYWTPKNWKRVTVGLQLGGSPFSTIAPKFYLSSETTFLLIKWIELHVGYRYFYFPIRQSHLLTPGFTIHVAPVQIHVRYFLNLSQINHRPFPPTVRHFAYAHINWQVNNRLSLLLGGGGGNALDFLNDYARPFLELYGPESQNFTQYTFQIRLSSQIRVAFRQYILLNYVYSRESFALPEDKATGLTGPVESDLHTITVGYRYRF